MQAVPKSKRTTFRSIAAALNMPRSTLHDYYKRGIFVKYSSSVRPSLTDANKVVRVKWAMDHLHVVDGSQVGFGNLMEYVHVDEKWFFGTSVKKTYYLAPGEEPPHRTCKSKHFINKVMFLSAVARPRWDPVKNEWFDGKIGTWHFTTKVPAVRGKVIRMEGNNNYKIPHMHKVKLAARGRLPEIVVADRDVINNGLALLSATDVDSKVDELAQETVLAMELSEFCSQLELLVVRSDPDAEDDVDDDDDPDDVEIDLDELFGTL
ncbi:hypothetical protein DYB34_013211 [Aphanomyces astaci]|nr:hypothetical protein DYB34_013211 [Aphanomyces astaci]